GLKQVGRNNSNKTNQPIHTRLREDSMVSGKKTMGVVALVTAMVVLQLVLAPTAMARTPKGMKHDELIQVVFGEGMVTRKIGCVETCFISGVCTYSATISGCYCDGGWCVADQ
uniref:Invertebrate defensins family profile domain-containing protein n=1 Tax=Aegilops tauschii subsp. strangulata TaxID=200361 RepID=A0A453DDK2_AEGTS